MSEIADNPDSVETPVAKRVSTRKLWILAAPVAAGLAMLVALWGLNSFQAGSNRPKSVQKSAADSAPPQIPAHERAALEEQLKRNPDHPPILMRLAEMEREAGRPAGAIPYLRKILDKDSTNLDARLELSRVLYETNDVDGAVKEIQKLLADHPGQVDALYNLGAIYANQNRMDLARQAWAKAVASDPQSESGKRAKDGLAQLSR